MYASSRSLLLSVCIISFRRPGLLKQCLDRISPGKQTLDFSYYEVVVSDDCPQSSARRVVESSGFARWVQGPSQGVAANRNNVVKAAVGDWIVFVDDDELPKSDWLETIYQAASSEQWDVIEGRVEPIHYPDSILWLAPLICQGGAFCTANLAICHSTFDDLGGFDLRNNVSHEDIEFGARIVSASLRTFYLDDAIVYHPARRISLRQLLLRLLQNYCHTYTYQHSLNLHSPLSIMHLFSWSVRYLIVCNRLEWAFKPRDHIIRPMLLAVVRIVVTPLALAKLILSSTCLYEPRKQELNLNP